MSLSVLLVDDEDLAIERLTTFFQDIEGAEIVGVAHDADGAAEAIERLKPDVVLLDIQMPGRSGMALAADLPIETRPEIIFITAFEHYAPDAFEVEAADYLLKPVRLDRLRQAMTRAIRRYRLRNSAQFDPAEAGQTGRADPGYVRELWVPVAGGATVRVAIEDIDWIEAAKDYVMLHTALRSYLHRISMSRLEQMIDPAQLIRVHRSTFVNPALVSEVRRLGKGLIALALRDGAVVPVGPSYSKEVLARLQGKVS
ncbi:LytR/AlgR family response regulator transcription factor [Qipengyuania atrilutea]|uniref:Response regulator transcription factor n=1 Tax=Qipengyuania atrilutea TaxID=2744473 RepID=A0A850H702_9SPHN|nr:LytTR family DNA-binding domain-containing protein [Actirhodobacter atriluteus]NVD45922.1 response regulator transcription factor [Actirhodobacter atriluteus]